MTGQTLLDTMEILNQELQLQTSEADVVRGLLALNIAQDAFEIMAAKEGKLMGDSTTTVVTVANTETTAWPTGFLRINDIQLLDDNSVPISDLTNLNKVGSHIGAVSWPLNLFAAPTTGAPTAFYTNGRLIYWAPKPDTVYTLRVYGFAHATDITASGTFAYDDSISFPLASFAVKLLKIGVDDGAGAVDQLAKESFKDILAALSALVRDGGTPLIYSHPHVT